MSRRGNPTQITSAILMRFAAVIGEGPALRIAAHFGGRQVYVPKRPHADSELVQVIGERAVELLGPRYGGQPYSIPISEGKRARIIELRIIQKKTADETAELVGCTVRHVWSVTAQYNAARGTSSVDESDIHLQSDLFAE